MATATGCRGLSYVSKEQQAVVVARKQLTSKFYVQTWSEGNSVLLARLLACLLACSLARLLASFLFDYWPFFVKGILSQQKIFVWTIKNGSYLFRNLVYLLSGSYIWVLLFFKNRLTSSQEQDIPSSRLR